MKFDVKTVNEILDIDDAFKAPTKLMELMMDDDKRVETFKKFLEVSTDMSFDWFHEYFSDDYLAFSKIVELPKNDEVLRACNLKGWE
ncbi:hypothetical protein [Lactobacillus delbrueckii]|uniref:hypothetical protein n=1 Tax=Lactobacillus delbrueckii TaxID=1584 RepID=UPI0035CAD2CF